MKLCVFIALLALCGASPTKKAFWKGTSFDASVEEMRAMCADDDPIACLKYKAISFLDNLLQKDSFQVGDDVQVSRNSYQSNEASQRSDGDLEEKVEDFIKSHDVTVNEPIFGSKLTLAARNLDSQEIDLKVNFAGPVEGRGKARIKKIIAPILVFVLLKAMTLVPLALGILGLKAWNSLQLAFLSFMVSVGLAIFQLCKKIATEHAPPQIAAHPPWDPHFAARSFDGQKLAYSAYVQN